MNTTFSVGYSGKLDDLKKIIDASDKVKSVYTGGIAGMIAGGRPQYSESLDALSEQIKFAHSKGVSFDVALNAPCGLKDKSDKDWWRSVKEYLKELEARGVDSVTVSHPFLMNLVKSHTEMQITVSTICEIMTARAALYYEELGGDVIVPSMNVNMNPQELRLMSRVLKRARLQIMVNEHCLGDCPWRRFHHSHYSHSNTEIDYHLNCKRLFLHNPYLLLTNNAIRPEDIHRYEDITNDFKIVGRLAPIDDLVLRVKAYAEQSFDGNFVKLSDSMLARSVDIPNKQLDGLIQKKFSCSRICRECRYCEELFGQVGTRTK
ncbi:U32 family peptidase [Verrucomicrobiota bacterium]